MASLKYGRTPHLTFSPGATNDDKRLASNAHFLGVDIVFTSKLDGSSVALTHTECFARTHAHAPKHPAFNLFKQTHSTIKHAIPKNLIIYAEDCFARHSVVYTELPSYLFAFNILNIDTGTFLDWDTVETVAGALQIATAPVLGRARFDSEKALEREIKRLAGQPEFGAKEREGVVIRVASAFGQREFSRSVAKYVNQSFIEINKDEHWMHKQVVKNGLRGQHDNRH